MLLLLLFLLLLLGCVGVLGINIKWSIEKKAPQSAALGRAEVLSMEGGWEGGVA